MDILVAINRFEKTGGAENYAFAMIVELLKLGHSVEYFTFVKGEVSNKVESLGVKFRSKKSYDLIFATHNTVILPLRQYGCIIQTCHGIFADLEQPSPHADFHVSISYEVHKYLEEKNINSTIINNGIDCERFYPQKEINDKLTSVLSLSQSEQANELISACCYEIGIKYKKLNKHIENKWEIENHINDADLVVGIGRSLYDAMACGRTIISYDYRDYSKDFGDGYLNSMNIEDSFKYNCSGRGTQRTFTKESFIQELKKYNKADGIFFREYAFQNLNICTSVQKYLNIIPKEEYNTIRIKRLERNIENQEKDIFNIYSSKDFRLGQLILKPLRKIKKFIQ